MQKASVFDAFGPSGRSPHAHMFGHSELLVPIGMSAVLYRLWLEFSETAQTAGIAVRETIEEGSLVISAFSGELISLIKIGTGNC